jgi:hypothetical protein
MDSIRKIGIDHKSGGSCGDLGDVVQLDVAVFIKRRMESLQPFAKMFI